MQRQMQRKGLRPRIAASLIVAVWAVAVVVFGVLERLVDPETFDNVWLAMWWAMQTVTTVGFGDVVPQETAGRLIAAVLMLGGLALFAIVTGVITAAFVAQAQAYGSRDGEDPVVAKLDEMGAKLDSIAAELGRLRGRVK
jgi:voltage-gated potassium channel Kch